MNVEGVDIALTTLDKIVSVFFKPHVIKNSIKLLIDRWPQYFNLKIIHTPSPNEGGSRSSFSQLKTPLVDLLQPQNAIPNLNDGSTNLAGAEIQSNSQVLWEHIISMADVCLPLECYHILPCLYNEWSHFNPQSTIPSIEKGLVDLARAKMQPNSQVDRDRKIIMYGVCVSLGFCHILPYPIPSLQTLGDIMEDDHDSMASKHHPIQRRGEYIIMELKCNPRSRCFERTWQACHVSMCLLNLVSTNTHSSAIPLSWIADTRTSDTFVPRNIIEPRSALGTRVPQLGLVSRGTS